jgi:hypothetical protein
VGSDGKIAAADRITVQFNPVSLQLTVTNEPPKDSKDDKATQLIGTTSAELTMDLIFDTTDSGEDVLKTTKKLQAFVAPPLPTGKTAGKPMAAPQVLFEWGTLRFKGIAKSYKETIDFFSANGVALRSSINLTLSRPNAVFDPGESKSAGSMDSDLFDAPMNSAADAASGGGAPGAARALGAANNQESLRFGAGAGLTIGASIELKAPVAFASGKLGLSLGGGVGGGIGIGGGLGIGVGAGAGIGVSAGAGFSVGGSAEAGISGMARLSASEGAFNGLRITTSAGPSARLDPTKLVPKISSTTLATDAGATFRVGGKASLEGGAGLRANVGATGKLSFDAR